VARSSSAWSHGHLGELARLAGGSIALLAQDRDDPNARFANKKT
jgi:hypothetical protein